MNHINCESTDSESDTDNTISVNMITVKNDYEPIIYEQPFNSHFYENNRNFFEITTLDLLVIMYQLHKK